MCHTRLNKKIVRVLLGFRLGLGVRDSVGRPVVVVRLRLFNRHFDVPWEQTGLIVDSYISRRCSKFKLVWVRTRPRQASDLKLVYSHEIGLNPDGLVWESNVFQKSVLTQVVPDVDGPEKVDKTTKQASSWVPLVMPTLARERTFQNMIGIHFFYWCIVVLWTGRRHCYVFTVFFRVLFSRGFAFFEEKKNSFDLRKGVSH